MRPGVLSVTALAFAAVLVQGCDLNPTAPGRQQSSEDELRPVSAAKNGGGKVTTGTFDVTVTGDISGGGTGFASSLGDEIVINNSGNPGNLLVLDLLALDTSGCFASMGPGLTNFKATQPFRSDPESAVMHYYFDADDSRFHLEFGGSFDPAVVSWVDALEPGDSNTITSDGAAWTITTVRGKGSKTPCAEGTLGSVTILVTRTG